MGSTKSALGDLNKTVKNGIKGKLNEKSDQINLNAKDWPGYIAYTDNITPKDLDYLRDKVQKLK